MEYKLFLKLREKAGDFFDIAGDGGRSLYTKFKREIAGEMRDVFKTAKTVTEVIFTIYTPDLLDVSRKTLEIK